MGTVTWDYLTIPAEDHSRLAELGREGWELAAISGAARAPLLYFKRPQLTFRERVTLEQRATYFAALGLDPAEAPGEDQG